MRGLELTGFDPALTVVRCCSTQPPIRGRGFAFPVVSHGCLGLPKLRPTRRCHPNNSRFWTAGRGAGFALLPVALGGDRRAAHSLALPASRRVHMRVDSVAISGNTSARRVNWPF